MRNFGVLRALTGTIVLIFSCLFSVAQAELLVVQQDPAGILQPFAWKIASQETRQKIYHIILRYQWPSSTAYSLTGQLSDDERNLITYPTAGAEAIFIRSVLQKSVSPNLDVVYIPTTLYELCLLNYIFASPSQRFIHNATTLAQQFSEDEIRKAAIGGSGPGDVVKAFRNLFEDSQTFKPSDVYFELNEHIAGYFISKLKPTSTYELESYTRHHFMTLGGTMVEALVTNYQKPENAQIIKKTSCYDFSKLSNQLLATPTGPVLMASSILGQILTLEYELYEKNQSYLLRGTQMIDHVISLKEPISKIIDSTLHSTYQAYHDFETAVKDGTLKPRSISYGNSLFAAGMADVGAMAYNFFSHPYTTGYAVIINKKDYFAHQINHLFFVSPLPTFYAIFGSGTLFHSRSRAAMISIPKQETYIAGIGMGPYLDNVQFLLMHKDPLQHEVLFARHLANNARVIKWEEDGAMTEQGLHQAHAKAAQHFMQNASAGA